MKRRSFLSLATLLLAGCAVPPETLPIFHGFPVRLVIPALLGYAWTKYLVEMRVG